MVVFPFLLVGDDLELGGGRARVNSQWESLNGMELATCCCVPVVCGYTLHFSVLYTREESEKKKQTHHKLLINSSFDSRSEYFIDLERVHTKI